MNNKNNNTTTDVCGNKNDKKNDNKRNHNLF